VTTDEHRFKWLVVYVTTGGRQEIFRDNVPGAHHSVGATAL